MKRKAAGFTLIEVMVAIALMALVSIIAWRGLDRVANMQQRLAADTAETDDLLRVLGQLERDVSLRAPDTALIGVAPGVVSPLPQSLRIVFDAKPDGSAELDIVRGDAAEPGAWLRVSWFLDGTVLRRAAGLAARQYPLPPATGTAAVLDGVSRFTVRAWVPGRGWVGAPLPASGVVFSGLEISAERQTANGVERYRRVVIL